MNFKNPIWVVDEIRAPLFQQFTKRLAELMETTKENDEVTVFINSNGGDTQTTLGIYDLLHAWERQTVGVVAGRAVSGASLILQACRKRLMTRNSTLMLHRSTISIKDMTVENAQALLYKFGAYDNAFYAIYAERSGSKGAEIEIMAHRDVHFDAQKALTNGLIDEIIQDKICEADLNSCQPRPD